MSTAFQERPVQASAQAESRVAFASDVAEQLRRDLVKSRPFPTGTIIAWESVSAVTSYHYVAIFAGGAWFTSVVQDSQYMQKRMSHDELMMYFADRGDHLANLRVATQFEEVSL